MVSGVSMEETSCFWTTLTMLEAGIITANMRRTFDIARSFNRLSRILNSPVTFLLVRFLLRLPTSLLSPIVF